MEAVFGVGSIVAFALGIGLWLYVNKDAPKFTTFLFLVAGTGLGGLIGAAVSRGTDWATATTSDLTTTLIGMGGSTLLSVAAVVATLEVFVKGMWKKKAKPRRWHPWLALALPTLAMASGVPVLAQLFSAASQITAVGG